MCRYLRFFLAALPEAAGALLVSLKAAPFHDGRGVIHILSRLWVTPRGGAALGHGLIRQLGYLAYGAGADPPAQYRGGAGPCGAGAPYRPAWSASCSGCPPARWPQRFSRTPKLDLPQLRHQSLPSALQFQLDGSPSSSHSTSCARICFSIRNACGNSRSLPSVASGALLPWWALPYLSHRSTPSPLLTQTVVHHPCLWQVRKGNRKVTESPDTPAC